LTQFFQGRPWDLFVHFHDSQGKVLVLVVVVALALYLR
jgi:hypothetical protein